MKLEDVFKFGRTYSITLTREGIGQISVNGIFEGIKNENDEEYAFYAFGNASVEEAGIKDFYVIDEPANDRITKYISITTKNKMTWTICELSEGGF